MRDGRGWFKFKLNKGHGWNGQRRDRGGGGGKVERWKSGSSVGSGQVTSTRNRIESVGGHDGSDKENPRVLLGATGRPLSAHLSPGATEVTEAGMGWEWADRTCILPRTASGDRRASCRFAYVFVSAFN